MNKTYDSEFVEDLISTWCAYVIDSTGKEPTDEEVEAQRNYLERKFIDQENDEMEAAIDELKEETREN